MLRALALLEDHTLLRKIHHLEDKIDVTFLNWASESDVISMLESELLDFLIISEKYSKLLDRLKKIHFEKPIIYSVSNPGTFDIHLTEALHFHVILQKDTSFLSYVSAIKSIKKYSAKTTENTDDETGIFMAKLGRQFKKIHIQDILFIESLGNYCQIHLKDKSHLLRYALKDLHQDINNRSIVRIHRKFLINLNNLDHFSVPESLCYVGKYKLKVGRKYKKVLKNTLTHQEKPA